MTDSVALDVNVVQGIAVAEGTVYGSKRNEHTGAEIHISQAYLLTSRKLEVLLSVFRYANFTTTTYIFPIAL